MKKYILIFSLLLLVGIITISCTKEDDELDDDLIAAATAGNLIAYQNTLTDTIVNSNSPHGRFSVWFNNIAVSALDPTTGELATGATFPDGALIVKARFAVKGGSPIGYVVMRKDAGNKLSGSGYIWGEYKADGTVIHSASEKGNTCISCHSAGSRDFIRVFDEL